MAETLGMLCDKLTIVKLKEYHSEDVQKLNSLQQQAVQLQTEINEYISAAVDGKIDPERMVFDANKVYKKEGNEITATTGSFGEVFYKLAGVNCELWHEQEKVYEFEKVPIAEKDVVVKRLAILNLERNSCIDKINSLFKELVLNK